MTFYQATLKYKCSENLWYTNQRKQIYMTRKKKAFYDPFISKNFISSFSIRKNKSKENMTKVALAKY